MQDFRSLEVWQRAHGFALGIRRATDAFPRIGYTELKSQIRRAAESVSGAPSSRPETRDANLARLEGVSVQDAALTTPMSSWRPRTDGNWWP